MHAPNKEQSEALRATSGKLTTLRRDYETLSIIDLPAVGAWRYATHPTTDLRCGAYAVDDGPIKLWVPGDPVPAEFIEAARNPDWRVSAFNDSFERLIEQFILGPRYGWPVAPIERHRCSQAAALALALPADLGKVARALALTHQKDAAGHKVMLQLSKPRRPRKDEDPAGVYWHNDPERLAILYRYVKQDVAVERELDHRIGSLSPELQAEWLLDAVINERGTYLDGTLLDAAINISEAAQREINAELQEITGGELKSINQQQIKEWLGQRGCDVPDIQKATMLKALERANLSPAARRIIELRIAGAHAAAAKLETMRDWRNADGRARGAFRFHGASTGRWTSFGIQTQNLKRPVVEDLGAAIEAVATGDLNHMRQLYAQPMSVVGDTARAIFRASPGRRLITGDFSGVESRITAWVSGQQSKLNQWAKFDRTGNPEDEPYFVLGCKFGLKGAQARSIGKTADLAFGYMGAEGAWRKLAPADDTSTSVEIKQRQLAWHRAHPETVRFWAAINQAAIRAVQTPGTVVQCKRIAFKYSGDFLFMQLPNERPIAYPFPRLKRGERGDRVVVFMDNEKGKWVECRNGRGAYGGVWIENCVQAIARDLFAAAMPRLEAAGYRIVLHVHDELCCEVPTDFGSPEEFQRILTTAPSWAEGLPIAAKVRVGDRFCKISKSTPAEEQPPMASEEDPAEEDPAEEDPVEEDSVADGGEDAPAHTAEGQHNRGADDQQHNNEHACGGSAGSKWTEAMRAPDTKPRTDANVALTFLQVLRPDGPWVLTAIVPDGSTTTRSFMDAESARKFIETCNHDQNLYFTGNLCGAPSKKPNKADMTGAIMLHTDDDPRDGETPEAAKARIQAAYEAHDPPPSITIDSGNGLQGLWLLQKEFAIPKMGDVELRVAEIEDRNRALAAALGTQSGTHNVDRLLRLPGTINWPNKVKRAKGRAPCQAGIVRIIDARYALQQFAKAPRQEKSSTSGADTKYEDIAPDDPRLGKLAKKWIVLAYEGVGIENYETRSHAVFAFACACIRAKIIDSVIAGCLMHWPIGEHVRAQADVARCVRRNLEHAHQSVTDSILFKMNEKHAVLPIGGKTRVATWGEDYEFPGRETIVRFSSFEDFAALQNKYRIIFKGKDKRGKPVTTEIGQGTYWINHPGRRQYDGGMRFMPQRDEDVVGDTLNLWQGFAVASRKPEGMSGAAGCKLFLEHGRRIICSGDEEHYDYLMKREALIAQKRIRSEIAVALRTEAEGTGKGFWCRSLNFLYGTHAMQVLNSEHVTGKHNAHLETLLRLTADEALFALNPHHRNALFGLITEPDLTVEPKFVGAYKAPNHLNIDITSNQNHYVPVSGTARRFFLPVVSAARAGDHDYFRAIDQQLHDGGFEALLYHLLFEIDVRNFNVRAVPKTAALAEQAAYSRKGVDLLVEQACNEGRVPCPYDEWPHVSCCIGSDGQYVTMEVRQGFDYFIDHHADRDLARLGSLTVKRRLKREWGCTTGDDTRRTVNGVKYHGIVWPPLAQLRAEFEKKFGPQEWVRPHSEWVSAEGKTAEGA